MAALPSMGALYISSPQQTSRSSVSSDSAQVEHQLVAGMGALQSHDNDGHRAYVPSHWSGCLGSQTSSDELDNYALHGSPALSSLPQTSSNQSSPRTWDSPEQLGPTPWEAATEQLHSRYPGLDPQLSGYLPNGDIPTSFPADGMSFVPSQSFDGADNDYQRARSQTEPYPAGYHTSPRDAYPSTPESGHPLSPCSTTLSMPMDDMASSLDDDVDSQAPTLVNPGPETKPRSKRSSAPSQLQAGEGKTEEPPYAQLIYRAFLSTPRQAMTLQEIYQWFRENTDRGKSPNKGWQNSIRHNLSMNQAFTKRERRNSSTKVDAKNGSTSPNAQTETKKSTEWYLEPWAVAGVQSTTRYRKDNQSRRSATSHGGLSSRVYRNYPAHHHHSFGRKGGRVLRGSRQSLRSNSSATANQPQLQHYQFPPSPHHHNAARGPFLHHLINDHSSSSFHHSPPQTQSMDRSNSGTGLDYDYPDPQLFPNTSSAAAPTTMARTASEPGAALDEPVTPEPLPLLHHSPYGQLLGGAVSPPPGHYHHGGHPNGLPFASPAAYPLPEVYGDAMDTDGGAYAHHLHHQQQQHHHHQQVQGWVAAAAAAAAAGNGVGVGVVGLEGMGPCGEEGVAVAAGYHGLAQGF
ncbi:hypothetical protein B0I37DRAFT_1791 [Chaetomium sp. MPI-CAGE-AT-0009]|nr:hypothetical protein B0I37DRAFT_1791 [Chaetomium sp. MPI-CAGE-AT-0009]